MKVKKVEPITKKSSEQNVQEAFAIVAKQKLEREQRAMRRINEFILLVQEEEDVEVVIPPINLQPQIIIRAK